MRIDPTGKFSVGSRVLLKEPADVIDGSLLPTMCAVGSV